MSDYSRVLMRLCGALAMAGAVLGLIVNGLHPHTAETDLAATLRQIAADPSWVLVHGGIIVTIFLVVLSLRGVLRSLQETPGAALAELGYVAALLGGAMVLISTTLDGFVMKSAADTWASAPAPEQAAALWAATIVRQTNFGIWSVGMVVFFGAAFSLYGWAGTLSGVYPRWLGWAALGGGIGSAIAGARQLYRGQPDQLAENLFLASSLVITVWLFVTGRLLWRRAAQGARAAHQQQTAAPRPAVTPVAG